jgi:predicted  nucleic acid-binding Zn ribbon protein
VHAPHAFELQIGFVVTWQSAEVEHSTQVPAPVPLAKQTGFVVDLVEHAFDAADWHPVQALDTQKLFVASFVQSASPAHSTQVPAPVPLARQTGFVANLAEHALDAANWQPAQALDTQKLFVASFVHWLSAEHSTH